MERSEGENPEGKNTTEPRWFLNNDNGYKGPGYQNIAPMNSSSLNYDDGELSSIFELLEISTSHNSSVTNGHRRISMNRNTPVANDNNIFNSVNNSSVDWSFRQDALLQSDNTNLMRMRAQSAASGQMGFPAPQQNYPSSGLYNNYNPLLGKYNSNYGRMSLNAGAGAYNPRAYQNQLNSSLHNQNYYSSYNCYPPNNLADMHNGFRRPSYYSFLQKKLEEGNCEGIHVVFSEVKNYVRELMVDRIGSSLIQKFFEKCNKEQMDQLLFLILSDQHILVAICADTHGTRSMQKLLENLITREQRFLVLSVLKYFTINLSKCLFGRHVIQHCLIHFPSEETTHIQRVIVDRCLEFATDKNGCCVVQVCAEYTHGGDRDKILAQVAENAVSLSKHYYGNYVVSKLMTLRIPCVTEAILANLAGNYVSLAMNKHGSNVVETCLRQTQGNQPIQIIREIIESPDFLTVLQDRYGNYVAQSAIDISKGNIMHLAMIRRIGDHFQALQSHLYGKRVLARITGSKGRARVIVE